MENKSNIVKGAAKKGSRSIVSAFAIPALAAAFMLTACGASSTDTSSENKLGFEDTATSQISYTGSETDTGLDLVNMFTERELSETYDVSSSSKVTLNGTSASSDSEGALVSGSTVKITKEGTYVLSGRLDNGSIIVEAEDTAKVQIVLNNTEITSNAYTAIYAKSADKVFVTTASGTTNTISNGGRYSQTDDNNVDAVIFGKTDIVLNGSGTLNITAGSGHGVVLKDDLKVTGGKININVAEKGLEANESIRITNSDISITSGDDGIHAENDEDQTVSFIYIKDGNISIRSGDDGIHGSTETLITGGKLEVSQSNEALESDIVNISGGNISLISDDDGINAQSRVNISGGKTLINAGGDGIDSNGTISVSGGETYVSGSVQDRDSAFDYETNASITGGTFIATGMSGMAENFKDVDQGSILVSTGDQSAGTKVEITDGSGSVIASYSPVKRYNSVLVSAEALKTGETYTVTAGTYTGSVTLSDYVYGLGGDARHR